MLWEFLTEYLPMRGHSLLPVADRRGFGELARLWLSGVAVPHLGAKDQEALQKETGLPTTLFGFLQHFTDGQHLADGRKLTVSEALSLGIACRQSDRRWHATPSHRDYFSMVEAIRRSAHTSKHSDDIECEFCGRVFSGKGKCTCCGRAN